MANKNQKFFTYEGTISEISAKEKINFKNADGSDGFFMKQIVTVDCLVGEGEWSRNLPIPFGVNGKKQEALEAFSVGEDVKVDFFITAKNGFVNLNMSKIEKSGMNQEQGLPDISQAPDGQDDLPFN